MPKTSAPWLRIRSSTSAPGSFPTSGPRASATPAVDCSAVWSMWYFEYSYDSTAVPKPKRSTTVSSSSVPTRDTYRLGGSRVRS